AGLVGVLTRPCAQLKCVRSNPDAKIKPQRNATTIAAPKRARVYRLDIDAILLGEVLLTYVVPIEFAQVSAVKDCSPTAALPQDDNTAVRHATAGPRFLPWAGTIDS